MATRCGGSRGFAVQSISTRRFVLPVYVDLDGGGKFFSPGWDSLAVVGDTEVESIDVFAPSVVRPGERFTLAIRAADRWFNRPTGAIPAWEVRLGDEVPPVPAGGCRRSRRSRVSRCRARVSRFEVRSADGRVRGALQPGVGARDGEPRILFGELHGHTDFAEAQGTPEEYYDYGAQDARLDFMALTEHDSWLDAAEWRTLQELAKPTNAEGRVIAFLAYEWTAQRSTGGHHNVIFRNGDTEMVPFRWRRRCPSSIAACTPRRRPTTWSSFRTRTPPATGPRAIPSSSDWSSSTRCTAPSSGSPTSTCRTVGGRLRRRLRRPPGEARPRALVARRDAGSARRAGGGDRSGEDRGRHLRRPAPPVVVRHLGPAHPARRRAQRVRHGHAPTGRRRAPAARPRRGHGADRPHRRGEERRDRAVARLSVGAVGGEGVGADRVRVVVRGLPSAERQSAPLPGVGGNARDRGREIRALDDSGVDNRYTESVARDPPRPAASATTSRPAAAATSSWSSSTAPTPTPRSPSTSRPAARSGWRAAWRGRRLRTFRRSVSPSGSANCATAASSRRRTSSATTTASRCSSSIPPHRSTARSSGSTSRRDRRRGRGRRGDYYYLRVNQLDGSRAWSSPWWVGGTVAGSKSSQCAGEALISGCVAARTASRRSPARRRP